MGFFLFLVLKEAWREKSVDAKKTQELKIILGVKRRCQSDVRIVPFSIPNIFDF